LIKPTILKTSTILIYKVLTTHLIGNVLKTKVEKNFQKLDFTLAFPVKDNEFTEIQVFIASK
jgi:hypothetical protein